MLRETLILGSMSFWFLGRGVKSVSGYVAAGRGGEGEGRGLIQFLILQLLPCAGKGRQAPARDTRPIQVLEATPPGILRLVTKNK